MKAGEIGRSAMNPLSGRKNAGAGAWQESALIMAFLDIIAPASGTGRR
jgi:hypothetical protein